MRTPLHGVMGMIELLQQTELSPLQLHYVRGARQSGDTLLTLIDDVLDLSKIEAGKVELEHAPFYLPSLAQRHVADVRRPGGSQAVCGLPPRCRTGCNVMVRGDAHRLRRILTNLVANALKFTSEGGVAIRMNAVGRDGRPGLAALRGGGYRDRHSRGQAAGDLRGVLPGRQLDHAALRRHRAWAVDRAAALPPDVGRDRRQQRARRGLDVLVPRAAGDRHGAWPCPPRQRARCRAASGRNRDRGAASCRPRSAASRQRWRGLAAGRSISCWSRTT